MKKHNHTTIRGLAVAVVLVTVFASIPDIRCCASASEPNTPMITDLTSSRTMLGEGENAILTLSIINPIGNSPVDAQLILRVPSGISVTSSSFADSGAGMYPCTRHIEGGDGTRYVELGIVGSQPGTYTVRSEVHYRFESEETNVLHDEIEITITTDAVPAPTPKPDTKRSAPRSDDGDDDIWHPGLGSLLLFVGGGVIYAKSEMGKIDGRHGTGRRATIYRERTDPTETHSDVDYVTSLVKQTT